MTDLLIINALVLPMTAERKAFRGFVRVDGDGHRRSRR